MKRVLNIDLDYDVEELRKAVPEGGKEVPPNPEITRNVIESTWLNNHPKMNVKQARVWRRIVKACEKGMATKQYLVVISNDDFEALQAEIEKCEYDSRQAFIVPVLQDELERIKGLTDEQSRQILEATEASRKATDQVNKVLEMSK